ncbi:glycosyltransferase family 39 protein [Allocoleopsis sp.]|uniref:glycosyltransferase family 39 protein n=1 Tax=Allocoleopsis sp. TaxID=3088169 RepID=UPI002FD1DC27
MKITSTTHWALPPSWLRVLVIFLLILGVFFRFANLGLKVYWHDETITSLHLAGYTGEDVRQRIFNGGVIGVQDLLKYQYPTPETSLQDTIRTLIIEDPQHPPIFYILTRLWMQGFGNSVAVIRSVSALISLFVFPCTYWLCVELFESSLVGWVAIALSAVSPVYVVFAQEARGYSLLMVTILLSSASLLRAMRVKTIGSWILYAVTLALGLYSLPLILLTAIGHGFYVVLVTGFRWNKTITAYLLASVAGALAFTPWLSLTLNSLTKAQTSTAWSATKVPLSRLLKSWVGNISRVFFDINLDATAPAIYTIPPVLILVILVGYSFYFLCRKTPSKIYLFILTMIGVPFLTLLIPDLISGGLRSSVPRYLVPCFLGILLTVAYLLANKIVSASLRQQKIWQSLMLLLICAGVASCVVYSQSQVWWNKKPSDTHVQAATIINQTNRPLLITSYYQANFGELLSMSYLLNPKVQLQLVSEPNIPKIPQGFSDIFVFNPSPALKSGLDRDYNSKVEPIKPSELQLWQLKN